MLQNARVTAFTGSEILRENQQGLKLPPKSARVFFISLLSYRKIMFEKPNEVLGDVLLVFN